MKNYEIESQIREWLNNNFYEYHNYDEFKEDAKEWWFNLKQQLGLDNKADTVFNEVFDELAENYFIEEIERKYDFPLGIGLGIAYVNIPYKYFLEFVENVSTVQELKKKVEEHTTPYAWGTTAVGSWGNFWFEVIRDKDDLKRIEKEHNKYYYLTFLCVLATHGNNI